MKNTRIIRGSSWNHIESIQRIQHLTFQPIWTVDYYTGFRILKLTKI